MIDYDHFEIDFSNVGINYPALAEVGEFFKLVIQLHPARFIIVKQTMPGCDCQEAYGPPPIPKYW